MTGPLICDTHFFSVNSQNYYFCTFFRKTYLYDLIFRESAKMGRKIPGSKHHGAKDPLKQQEKRAEKIKTKVGRVLVVSTSTR